MTALMGRSQVAEPWLVRPGWGIFVDLTPPELITTRRLRQLRRIIACALGIVVLLCVAGYVLATQRQTTARSTLDTVQLQTTQLQHQTSRYAYVTRIEGTVKAARAQIAILMKGDIALDALLADISGALPRDMRITDESLTVSLAAVADGRSAPPTGQVSTAGGTRIGTMTITGTSATLDDLSEFTVALGRLAGIVDIVPTSNTAGDHDVEWTLTLNLTNHLYSKRFGGGK